MSNPYGPRTLGKDRFYFEKKTISSSTFNTDADFAVALISKNSILITNEGSGSIEYSFDGVKVHGQLNPALGKTSIVVNDASIVKIWFKLQSGVPSVVSVQNDSFIPANVNVDLSGSSFGGTSSTFNDLFPSLGTAVGFTDGTEMQGARVYDVDSGVGTEYVLGTVLRSSASGGSVELGTETNPIRVDPTGDTDQPVILKSGDKGTTPVANVTSENVDANTQALHVYVKGSSNDANHPLVLDGYAALDGFGRFRVSMPHTIFENKQIVDSQSIIWNNSLTSGGTTNYSSSRASTTLNVTSTIGSRVIRQTKQRFHYQAGRSFLTYVTFVMGNSVPGVSKKIGYFDDNNGIYFEDTGSVRRLVVRSSVSGSVDNSNYANQANWNIDKMDGYGPSKITLDVSKAQIFFVDFEWLGVGTVRCGFVINGQMYYVHQFHHSNIIGSVYMSNPNLPIRAEIENVSAISGSSLEQICCSVGSEGGYDNPGLSFSIDRGATPLSGVDNLYLYPLLSIRQKSTALGTQIFPEYIDMLCSSSNANFRWALVVNPTVNGVDNASWVDLSGSAVQYDVSRTSANYLTGGYIIASGYGSQKVTAASAIVKGSYTLGSTISGDRDQLILAIQKVGNSNDSFVGSLTWKEFS